MSSWKSACTKTRRYTLWALLALVPMLWNACGKVAFNSGTDSQNSTAACVPSPTNNNCASNVPPHPVSQSIAVKSTSNNDVDVLFVVDNSGSMQEEQMGIGNKINGFLDKIAGLNWQIALTTTDPGANTRDVNKVVRPWGDGQFRPFDSDTGTQFILKSTEVTAANAQTLLSNAVYVGDQGSGDERAINASYRAVQRSAQAGVYQDFFRPDARLAVIAISDEDECSTGVKDCIGMSDSSKPDNFVNMVHSQLGIDKVFSFSSIIFIPGDTTCLTGSNQGFTYDMLSKMTGGEEGSVCSTDFTTPLAAIGNKVQSLIRSVSLSCAPVDFDGDGKPDLKVTLQDGTVMTSGFQVSGTTVTFDTALPDGTHRFDFYCK